MLDHLKLADRFAEGLALARPLQALLQRQLCGHVGHQRQGQALALEITHDAGKAHVLGADEVFYGHPTIIEEQFSGI
ncbi:hypothetical protein D3C76_1062830 [compost metagenome]